MVQAEPHDPTGGRGASEPDIRQQRRLPLAFVEPEPWVFSCSVESIAVRRLDRPVMLGGGPNHFVVVHMDGAAPAHSPGTAGR